MPLPQAIARLNKRYTNRFIEPLVCRTPGFTIVHHVGRHSGRPYCTPLYLFKCNDSLLAALTYGPQADWAQNVLASGGTVDRDGTERVIAAASVVGRSRACPHLPRVVRAALRLLRVSEFMLLDVR